MEGDQVKAEVQAVRKQVGHPPLAFFTIKILKPYYFVNINLSTMQAVESANRSGNMDAYAQELLATIVSLTESKKTLQTYMLEQVGV